MGNKRAPIKRNRKSSKSVGGASSKLGIDGCVYKVGKDSRGLKLKGPSYALAAVIPLAIFLGYLIAHLRWPEEALDVDRGTRDEDDRDEERSYQDMMRKMWQKFSVRMRMIMIIFGFVIWSMGGKFQNIFMMLWYRLIALVMVVTPLLSIVFDTGRGNVFVYFRDQIWPGNEEGAPIEEMRMTCIEMGCGYLPDDNVEDNVACSEDNRGADVTEYNSVESRS